MSLTNTRSRVFLLVGSGVALLICVALVLFNPLSKDFIVRALLIGAFMGILTGAYLDWRLGRPTPWLLILIAVVLVGGGFYWSKDHAFGSSYNKVTQSRLAMQFLTAALTAFSAVVWFQLRRTMKIER